MTNVDVRAALARHRDEKPLLLSCDFHIDRLLDDDVCQTLTADLRGLVPSGFEVRVATRNLARMLPNSRGLYLFVWAPPVMINSGRPDTPHLDTRIVLYVGEAGAGSSGGTLRSRYRSEYAECVGGNPENLWQHGNDRKSRLKQWLSLSPLEYWFAEIEDRSRISELETRMISLLNPPLNDKGRRKLKPSSIQNAF